MSLYGNWWKLGFDATMLALESQQVIGLRMLKLSTGGAAAQAEAMRMVTEKVAAAGEAAMMLASGGSGAGVVAGYRRKVRANARRLQRR
ncbi:MULTISPECIES: hypothetical protein [Methylobacterium]|uniref:Antifreeze protein n=1 Tax=Methylobacterium jeotgali TaxID=381630 RepID=A0ABQ4SX77_9HYPH|nr:MULTISPECIES: hypothetical protein [Methylobacterium]PIU07544.1 MAG: hypothetical protein COT56_04810 [Methylobacterium sp. CG09_land_8_20_14_0_10_71_15]PIU13331.1 MAG: hypothetical protein COT28_11950 [Methylobacterium sp. CG08_land_8_20_14_0_20_71_15]GBU17756.1 hypothetical protein AwMethylo_19710 [Methylobacterium sp.]GJE06414.1 hypothetical protein AOPFMNJM_1732 [Methylobacterium jeotgali]